MATKPVNSYEHSVYDRHRRAHLRNGRFCLFLPDISSLLFVHGLHAIMHETIGPMLLFFYFFQGAQRSSNELSHYSLVAISNGIDRW
jgi:hypothetical protein